MDHEFLELISSLVCLIEEGLITFINKSGQQMFELESREDVIGIPFETFVVEDYRFLTEGGWELLAAEEFLPLKMKRADASVFDAELRVRALNRDRGGFMIEVRDISKFVKSAEALREREERLHGILRSVAEGIIALSEHGGVESANPAAERMFGFGPGEMIGVPCDSLFGGGDGESGDDPLSSCLAGQGGGSLARPVERLGRRRDGGVFPMEIAVSELRQGRQRLFTAVLRDISERKENEERIRRLAHHDHLTGLPNRNLLNDRMNHALARARRHGGRMAVLYVDLDHFKPINDTLGHMAGDMVLKEVAARLTDCVRSSDTVARVGGDEFVLVIEEIARPGEAARVARKIVDVLTAPIAVGKTECTISASIGVAVFPDDGLTIDEVSKAADAAMYRIKHSSRNGYRFFTGDDDALLE